MEKIRTGIQMVIFFGGEYDKALFEWETSTSVVFMPGKHLLNDVNGLCNRPGR